MSEDPTRSGGTPHDSGVEPKGSAVEPQGSPGQVEPREPSFGARAAESGRRVVTAVAIAAGLIAAVLLGWFLFGEWWISVVRQRVDGSAFSGFAFGLTVGFIATVLAAILVRFILVRRMPGFLRVVLGVLLAVPLAPLVFSLRIAMNKSSGKPGSLEYQMLVDGRGYQSGVFFGTLVALLIVVAVVWWGISRRKARAEDRAHVSDTQH